MKGSSKIDPSLLLSDPLFTSEFLEFGKLMGFERDTDFLNWIQTSPRFSTLRINTLKTSTELFINKISTWIDKQCAKKNLPQPKIYQHNSVKDVIIVESTAKSTLETKSNDELGNVIVDVHCGAAVLRGSDIFVPGIVGAPMNLQSGDLVNVYSNLKGKCLKGSDSKLFEGELYFLGRGQALFSRDEIFKEPYAHRGVGIEMMNATSNIPSFDTDFSDLFVLQNYPSILAGHMLEPRKNETILDMCASPGGKTSHFATLMENTGSVIAFDKSKPKIENISKLCQSLGLTNVRPYVQDATKVLQLTEKNPNDERLGPFDRILVDAPCSALGQRPKLKITMTSKELKSFPVLQRKLLNVAVKLLKPGGRLVFSTCTINPAENADNVSWIKDKFNGILNHVRTESFDGPFRNAADDVENDTIGFFIASFDKTK